MKLILGNPGSGKTKALLALSEKHNIPILSESDARVQRLLVKASNYGFHIPTPLTVNQLDSSVKAVYVDDVKRLLETLFNIEVECITINRDDALQVVDLDSQS
jgi:hypothetical protein